MITAVDTNVLLDVLTADVEFAEPSARALQRCLREGTVVACDVVWGETAGAVAAPALFRDAMKTLGVEYAPLPREAAELAGQAWHRYRKAGGRRTRMVADFLIGAHAITACDRLLSRDRGFYREYFRSLSVLDPTQKTRA